MVTRLRRWWRRQRHLWYIPDKSIPDYVDALARGEPPFDRPPLDEPKPEPRRAGLMGLLELLKSWLRRECPDCARSEGYCERHKYAVVAGRCVNRNSREYFEALRDELGDR